MAEIRPVSTPAAMAPAAAPGGPVRAQAVRSAQAAFFQAALASPAPAASPDTGRPLTQAAPVNAFDLDTPAPARPLRPGSLVDLKV